MPSTSPTRSENDSSQAGIAGSDVELGRRSAQVRSDHPLLSALKRTLRNPMGAFGVLILMALIFVALAAPLIAPYDPLQHHPEEAFAAPGSKYLLGSDQFGRDIFSRVIYGSRASLLVGVVAVSLGAGVGIPLGLIAGYRGGVIDTVIMRLWDALLAFPAIILGIAVITVLGPGTINAAYTLAIASMPTFSRLTRSIVLSEREKEYVQAAELLGGSAGRVLFRHLLPNSLGSLLVEVGLAMSWAVLIEAGLSFLGLGTQPPTPSWGAMLNDSRAFLAQAPWYAISPGVAIALLVLGLTFLADALRDALDPRQLSR